MNTSIRKPPGVPEDMTTISITVPVSRLTQVYHAIAESISEQAAQAEPEPLYLNRDDAARRTGIHRDRLSSLVKTGVLNNYGTPAKLKFSLAEIQRWQEHE